LAGAKYENDGASNSELDSHADTCVVGKNAIIIHDFERPVNVTGYDQSVATTKARTVTAAVAYDEPDTGRVLIFIIHQAIEIPGMSNNLLCPMQLRLNDVIVSEVPKFLTTNPTEETHTIQVQERDSLEMTMIRLSLKGVTSYFPTRKPTISEYEQDETAKYELTFETPEWDPHDIQFAQQEEAYTDHNGRLREPEAPQPHNLFVSSVSSSTHYDEGESLLSALKSNVNVSNANVSGVKSSAKMNKVDAEALSQKWGIGIESARRTIRVSTQRGVRTVLHPALSRRFRTNDRQLRYRRLRSDVFTDTLITNVISKRMNRYAQVFVTSYGWCRVFPMRKKSDAHEALSLLFKRDGVPPKIICDGSLEQVKGRFNQKTREADCWTKQIEPYSQWQNAAEGGIREVKKGAGRKMVKKKSPKMLWDDCLELEGQIRSNTAHDIFELQGETPETILSGETSDISQLCELGWYDWCKFRDVAAPFPQDKQVLGRYLGPSVDIGPAMTAKLLKSNGQVIHTSTYRSLTPDELLSVEESKARDEFDKKIAIKLGPAAEPGDIDDDEVETPMFERYCDDTDGEIQQTPDADEKETTPEVMDEYLGADVLLPLGDTMVSGKVRGRKRDHEGAIHGTRNPNPILDTRTYSVQFPNGEEAEYAANVIAQNMYAQCDQEGNQWLLMEAIVDYKTDGHAVKVADMYITRNGRQHIRKTTIGWKLCIKWRDGSTSWERLADLKESYPVEVAEYAAAQSIDNEPAFVWWVPHTLKKRNHIIAAVSKRYHKRNYKYGFQVPNTVDEAKEIDKEQGNTMWMDSVEKEMNAVNVAFKFLDDDYVIPPGYSQVHGSHLIFDIKMENFRRKSRYVAGGHTVASPATLTYASVVSRESVRIALTMAALNDLEVKACDIMNAYLSAPAAERVWLKAGPEFGPNAGKRAIIVRALYGLKSAGSSFRNHLADCMRTIGYKSCLADADVWYKPMVRPDGFKYYAYVLIYSDDILAIHHDAMKQLNELDYYFKMKPGSLGDPDFYLGGKLRNIQLANGVWAWGISPSKYVQEAVRNVEEYIKKTFNGRTLLKRAPTPFENDYAPELDTTPVLDPAQANFYQSQIGVLRWMVELGRYDIITETSLLASQTAMPREGHLDAMLRMFAHVKVKHNSRMVFDPTYPSIDMSDFKQCDWKNFYGNVKEAIPPDAPEPRGKDVDLRLYCDSDHAGEKLTRRSRTGYIIFMNMAPIVWFSKRQPTIETSVFGAEFVSMKNGMETTRGLRYKLRMMGVPLSGPTYIYGDNMSVIHNTQRPESTLKKKSNSICYHAVRESVAMNESITGHVSTHANPADVATKVLSGGQKRDGLIGLVLYDLTDYD
jgi:hypothetical protein